MIGKNSVIVDNPRLNFRDAFEVIGNKPVFILDTNFKLSSIEDLTLFDKLERERIYIITSKKQKNMSIKSSCFLKGVNIKNVKSDLGFLNIKEVLKIVSKMGVNRLMVEGGASVWTSFLKTGYFDEIVMFTGSKIINDSALSCFNDFLPPDTQLGDFPNLTLTSLQNWKDDIEARWEVRS